MISRRQLIGGAVAGSVLGSIQMADAVEASTSRRSAALVIVDDRFEAARTLAQSFVAAVVPRVALPRDVLDLWRERLAPLCRSGSAIAGVTTERGLFLLQTLAADHRLRLLSRTVHAAPRGAEPLVSWMLGPK